MARPQSESLSPMPTTAAQRNRPARAVNAGAWVERLGVTAALGALALLVVALQDPWHQPLNWDPGIYALISQYVAQGLAPHQAAFNEQASLSFLLGGAAMWLGDWIGLHHLISFRLAAMLVLAAVVVLTYRVGWAFTRSRLAGLAAGILLLGFTGYTARVALALEPKAFMLLPGLAALYFLYRRKWFWAGACGAAAGFAWQIAWGYLVVALLLAGLQGGGTARRRGRALGFAASGALVVAASYLLFYVAHRAQVEMLQQTFLAPLLMHADTTRPLLARLEQLARYFARGFPESIAVGIFGAVGLAAWLGAHLVPWRRGFLRRAAYYSLLNRRTAGTLLVTAGFLLYLLYDFQNFPDWIPLLPFVALFAAWLIESVLGELLRAWKPAPSRRRAALAGLVVILLAVSVLPTAAQAQSQPSLGRTWQEQQAVADALNAQLGAEAVWVVGQAETLFFMRRQNANKYIYLFGKVDAAADAFEPGGLRQVIIDSQTRRPALLVLARLDGDIFATPAHLQLLERAHNPYVLLKRCRTMVSGRYFVRADLADALFPVGGQGCIRR